MEFLSDYGLFLAKSATIVVAIVAVVLLITSAASKEISEVKSRLKIKKLNKKFLDMKHQLQEKILDKHELKEIRKEEKQKQKLEKKLAKEAGKARRRKIYVLNFKGDIKATAVEALRDEVTAILNVATPKDEVVVCVESTGGMVNTYGLATSQLLRFKENDIPLIVCVDKVAASGGYLMSCVADRILAAPFAIIGSIGVIAQLPNFHRLLKKKDIDFEQITAGEFKRTLTMFGENTDKGREKFKDEIQEIHDLFKQYISQNRPNIELDKVATGEYWLAEYAKELNLVDELQTSDNYLLKASANADLFEIQIVPKKTLMEMVLKSIQMTMDKFFVGLRQQQQDSRYF